MTLCHELSGESSSDSKDSSVDDKQEDDVQRLERHDLFVTRADTILRPLFRYTFTNRGFFDVSLHGTRV